MHGNKKRWYKSKTMIVNGAAAAVAIADQITPILPPGAQQVVLAALPVVNILLRLVTHQAVGK